MFKDYDKYLSTSLKVYIFVLMVIFIMKIVGLDYFGIDYQNKLIIFIDNKLNIPLVNNFIQYIVLAFQLYLYTYIVSKKKPKLLLILITTGINFIISYFLFKYKLESFYYIITFLILIIHFKINGVKLKESIKFLIINTILQAISLITRNNTITEYSFTLSLILNIDYMLMLLIWCELIRKGGIICLHHGFYSLKKLNLSTLLKELQRKLHNFKQLDKEEKLTHIIYFILSFIWNVGTIIIVLLVARLNDTFIECLFILTSFWLSKSVFGKPFHLPSMKQCFIVSNLTYYLLNRLTTPLGISIFVPILLGVGLSYFTSKLVKKTYKPLYKGMPKELFEETILKVTDKESTKYKICYDFFINNKNALYLTGKYNYSEAGIRQIISRINKQIKDLK